MSVCRAPVVKFVVEEKGKARASVGERAPWVFLSVIRQRVLRDFGTECSKRKE